MKYSARAAVVALAACAGMGAAVQTAAAAALSPDRLEAAEQAAASSRVPFDLPLGGALQTMTGTTSQADLHGSLPGMPVVPPSVSAQEQGSAQEPGPSQHEGMRPLLPEPLVPALGAARGTPELSLAAPLVGHDGALREDGLVASLPEAPLKAVGTAATLGEPITYSHDDEVIDLSRLAPSLTTPTVQSAPGGSVTVDQRATEQPMGHTVEDFLATATATAEELGAQH